MSRFGDNCCDFKKQYSVFKHANKDINDFRRRNWTHVAETTISTGELQKYVIKFTD